MRTPPEQQEEPSQNPNQQDPVPQDISSLYRDALLRPPEEEQEEPWMVPVRIGKLRKFSLWFFCPCLSFSLLIFCTAHSLSSHSPGRYKYDTNHMRISDTELSRSYLSCFYRVVGVMTRHSGLLGTIGSDSSFRIILKDFEEHVTLYMHKVLKSIRYDIGRVLPGVQLSTSPTL